MKARRARLRIIFMASAAPLAGLALWLLVPADSLSRGWLFAAFASAALAFYAPYALWEFWVARESERAFFAAQAAPAVHLLALLALFLATFALAREQSAGVLVVAAGSLGFFLCFQVVSAALFQMYDR